MGPNDTQVKRQWLVFDRKKGLLGVKKNISGAKAKEMSSNYMVTLLDPMNFKQLQDVQLHGNEYDWYDLPKDDPRVIYWKLFQLVYEADWEYNGYQDGDGITVEGAEIINEHEVFQKIRELFGR